MSSEFIVIDKSGGWANAVIAKDRSGKTNKVFTTSEEAYKAAEQFEDGIALGDIEASEDRVYTSKQVLEFRNKLINENPTIEGFDVHFDIKALKTKG
jgi:hypothetical protein